jgi:hypothetical protein
MIFSENRCTLFRIMLSRRAVLAYRENGALLSRAASRPVKGWHFDM